jgi:hypothetical protein
MPDNMNKRGPRDRSRVSLNEDWEVSWWTHRFNCSPEELKKAVKIAGNSVSNLQQYFRRRH